MYFDETFRNRYRNRSNEEIDSTNLEKSNSSGINDT